MAFKKKATIKVLEGERTANGRGRDGVVVRDENGNSIGVFRGEKHKKDKIVAYDKNGHRHDEYVSRDVGNQILNNLTSHTARKLEGTAFESYAKGGKELTGSVPKQLGSGSAGSGRLAEIRQEHSAAYEKWTDELDAKLKHLWLHRTSIRDLAKQFNRTEGAIRSRLIKFGFISE